MNREMLAIKNLSVGIEGKKILKNIDLKINYGEVHVVMGPNGSGKSTLANVLMDNPIYEVIEGDILFDGESIVDLSADKRARLGMFLSFQNPLELDGITVENFIRTAKQTRTDETIQILKFRKELYEKMDELSIDHKYATRYLNKGFSGGEKKKNEILQMLVLDPKLAILDETDSGLDVDATKIVSENLCRFRNENNALLIITHHHTLTSDIEPDFVHILVNGQMLMTGDADLIKKIENEGFGFIKDGVK